MKLLMFEVITPLGRIQRLGALLNNTDYVLDLNNAYAWWLSEHGPYAHNETQAVPLAQVILPETMRGLIDGGARSLEAAQTVLDYANSHFDVSEHKRYKGLNGENLIFELKTVRLKCPLPNPNSLRDFITFEAHIKRGYEIRQAPMPQEWYNRPVYYKGNHRSIIGPNLPVYWPSYTQKLDYELEYACVLGKSGINITEEQAEDYIFGYCILNDFSARDVQFKEMTVRLGPAKGKDFCTAIGPYIVTKDEIPDVRNLTMTAKVNGEIWSQGNSGTSHWTWPQIIAYLSQDEMIYPTDILGSGTVGGGCGYEHDRWIQPGDIVTLEVDHLGSLRNPIARTRQESPDEENES